MNCLWISWGYKRHPCGKLRCVTGVVDADPGFHTGKDADRHRSSDAAATPFSPFFRFWAPPVSELVSVKPPLDT